MASKSSSSFQAIATENNEHSGLWLQLVTAYFLQGSAVVVAIVCICVFKVSWAGWDEAMT